MNCKQRREISATSGGGFSQAGNHAVDQVEVFGFFGRHEVVAIGVFFDLLQSLAGVFDLKLVQSVLDASKFLPMDHDFFGSSLHSSQRLVDHDAGVWQRVPFSGRAGGQ